MSVKAARSQQTYTLTVALTIEGGEGLRLVWA
jgi:hypothetical protein